MKSLQQWADAIRRGDPIPLPLAALLTAATPVQRLGMYLRLRQERARVDARVISFGNLTAGGTGKTPAVIERARTETAAGHKVAVLTRGYGTQRNVEPLVVDSTNAQAVDVLGDEPALILRLVPKAIIVKCADRVAAARKAIQDHGCDTLILDDGYQYVRLERDENVLLIDARNPFSNGRLLPRGALREPIEAAARATHIILTRCDQARDVESLVTSLKRLCPNAPIRKTRHAPTRLWRVSDGTEQPIESLRGMRITALCGIANPEAFFTTLEALGAEIIEQRVYPDHANIPPNALRASTPIITTEKDAMRLHNPPNTTLALGVELQDV